MQVPHPWGWPCKVPDFHQSLEKGTGRGCRGVCRGTAGKMLSYGEVIERLQGLAQILVLPETRNACVPEAFERQFDAGQALRASRPAWRYHCEDASAAPHRPPSTHHPCLTLGRAPSGLFR